jgi:hypothetical protein
MRAECMRGSIVDKSCCSSPVRGCANIMHVKSPTLRLRSGQAFSQETREMGPGENNGERPVCMNA